jgi:hypothetical protein
MTEGRGDDPAAETPIGQGAEASSDRSSAVGFFFLVFFCVTRTVTNEFFFQVDPTELALAVAQFQLSKKVRSSSLFC